MDKGLQDLKSNALALRNIANTVLKQVELLEKASSTPPSARIAKKVDRVAELRARLLSGQGKPASAKKYKKAS